MKALHGAIEYVALLISALGAVVVFWGVAEAIASFLRMKVPSVRLETQIAESERIRQRLGAHLLLGLEIFIGGDILSSVVSPSWQKVGMLAAIVAIRTVLSYYLRLELRQGTR